MHEERLRILHEVKQAQKPEVDKYPVQLSDNMKRIKNREKRQKLNINGKKRRVKELARKRQQYGEYINEFYLPQINGKPKNLFIAQTGLEQL